MAFGEISNLYVISRYLDDSFFTESFKTTDVFRIDGSNYFLILFENVLNDNGISTVKFYFNK